MAHLWHLWRGFGVLPGQHNGPLRQQLGPLLAGPCGSPPLRAAASSMGITVDTVRWLAEEKMPILNVSCAQHPLAWR